MMDKAATQESKLLNNTHAPIVEKYLIEGRLADGEAALSRRLKDQGHDDQARFGLGMLQFLQAVERLGQDLYKFGVRDYEKTGFIMPFLRLPVRSNPNPQMISSQQLRTIVDTFRAKLLLAEHTLSAITASDVQLPLHFGMIKLNLNGDGRADEEDSLWKVYARLTNSTNIPIEQAQQFYIKFDRGDVHWLRGYCHLLASICDMYLAYDSKETFEYTAHLFFQKVDTPYEDLGKSVHLRGVNHDEGAILDLLAMIHLIRWQVVEPQRMEAALHHLEAVVSQSRETWKWIMAETDDDHEWLPNPRQTGVLPNVRVTDEMVKAWADIMDESEKLLKGELLIPFWRGEEGRGINLRKVFMEPRSFDLVMWVQGSAAVPYVQKGPLTKLETWQSLTGPFGHNFPGFALWFN